MNAARWLANNKAALVELLGDVETRLAAAKALESKVAPVVYRIHEPPSREKLVALKDYLSTFGIEFALGQVIKPSLFNRIIERVGDGDGRDDAAGEDHEGHADADDAQQSAGDERRA